MHLSGATVLVLAAVAFAAGLVDAIAGGGGLLTVPALMSVMPSSPHLALGTNKGQSVFGAIASAVSYWRRGGIDRERAASAFACALLGAAGGSALQLAVPAEPLRPVALVLLVAAALVVILHPLIVKQAGARKSVSPAVPGAIAFALGAYDGFFGPGTGSLLIVAYVTFLGDSMTRASGNAKIANLASNLAAVVIFAFKGTVLWHVSLPMAVGNALGAAVGARVALHGGDRFVRAIVLLVVLALVTKLTWDLVSRS